MGFFDSIGNILSNAPEIALSMIPGVGQYLGQSETNQANAQQTQNQMNFQETMSNTAHQREVRDLNAAGLNPMLSVMGGSGASSPSGAQATMQNPLSGLGSVTSSALDMLKLKKDLEQADASISLTETQEKKVDAEAEKAKNEAIDSNLTLGARTNPTLAMANATKYQPQGSLPSYYLQKTQAEKASNSALQTQAEADKMDSDVHKKFNIPDNVLQRINQVIAPATSAARIYRGK
jgi:hypothetical protein